MRYRFSLQPVDTMFFRGAGPMEAGQMTADAIFPPPVSVIAGAVRTAVLKQNNISFKAYNAGQVPEEVTALIGRSGEPAPFEVTGVLLRRNGMTYLPAPYSWFVDCSEKPANSAAFTGLKCLSAEPLSDIAGVKIRIGGSVVSPPVMKAQNEPFCLGGLWMREELLGNRPEKFKAGDLLFPGDLYGLESRTGIGLEYSRRSVRQGQLYSAGHIRLQEGVEIVIDCDRDPGLQKDSGVLVLGGEQRRCLYRFEDEPAESPVPAQRYIAAAPVALTENMLQHIIAAGRIGYLAGWDLARRFHKETTAWLPAGSVFDSKVSAQCRMLE